MATKTARGFQVRCVKCHDEDATLSIDLADLQAITCSSCDEVYSAREARDLAAAELARWDAIVKWVEAGEILASE